MRVKASDPSYPIIHTQYQAPSLLAHACKAPPPPRLSSLFPEFVNISQGCWSTNPHFKGNVQQTLPFKSSSLFASVQGHTLTHKPIHDKTSLTFMTPSALEGLFG